MSAAARAARADGGPPSWAEAGAWGSTWTARSCRPSGGRGALAARGADKLGDGRIVGTDQHDPKLKAEWHRRRRGNLEYRVEDATNLSFADGEFDMATAIEVLEHVPDPERTVSEMARVA